MEDCLSIASMTSTLTTVSLLASATDDSDEDEDGGGVKRKSLADEVNWEVSSFTTCTSTVCTLHMLTTSSCHHWKVKETYYKLQMILH